MLRPLMRRSKSSQADDEEKPFSVYIVPYLSLISEKEKKISAILKELDMSYSSIHSHKRAIISTSEPPDVVLCTIQKAN